MRRKILTLIVVLAGCLCAGGALAQDAGAVTCANVERSALQFSGAYKYPLNTSLKNACLWHKAYGGAYGALWINSVADTDSSSSPASAYALVYSSSAIRKNSVMNVYIHGAVIGGSGAADYVRFVQSDNVIYGTAAGYNRYAPLGLTSDITVNRAWNSTTSQIQSGVYGPVKLKVGEILSNPSNYSNYYEVESGARAGYIAYVVNLQAFRCYQGQTPYVENEACYSDPTTFVILDKPVTFTAKAEVDKINGGTNTTILPGDVTVTFKDTIARGNDAVDSSYTTGYCYRYWDSKSNTYSSWVGKNGGACNGATDTYQTSSIGMNGSATTSPTPSYTVKGVNNGEEVRICHQVGYYAQAMLGGDLTARTDAIWDWRESNWACTTVTAVRDEYYGKALVSSVDGNWTATNGKSVGANNTFTQSSGTEIHEIKNCDPVNGCTVKFWHYLKRAVGNGTTAYSIVRSSNYDSVSGGVNGTTIKSGTENFASGGEVKELEESFVNKLKPGQVVCETLTFDANTDTKGVALKVCAAATGAAQPPDAGNPDAPENPDANSGDTSLINIKVRNASVSKYNNFQREVYAKPGDRLVYRAVYNPVLQYTYNLRPQQMRIDGGAVHNGNGNTLGTLFNTYKSGGMLNWNNGFDVQQTKNNFVSVSLVGNYTGRLGDTTKQQRVNEYGMVQASDVGTSIDEKAEINPANSVERATAIKTTPTQVSFGMNGTSNLGNVSTSGKSEVARARVPYNFATEISVEPSAEVVYAGEGVSVKMNVNINPKRNSKTTDGTDAEAYATKADEVRRRLIVYNPDVVRTRSSGIMNGDKNADVCGGYFGYNSDDVNCGYAIDKTEELSAGVHPPEDVNFYVQDLRAGARVCVAAAVFPATSGADTNWNDKQYSRTWRVSDSKCFTVAKKPSLQVWGGNIYSAGAINTAVSVKNNLAGFGGYSISNPQSNSYVFGSWGELGVISAKKINGLASGAATGYTSDGLVANPGGSVERRGGESLCKRSPLTFANYPCSATSTDGLGGVTFVSNANRDKAAILANFAVEGEASVSGEVRVEGADSQYLYSSGDLSVAESSVSGGTHLVRADGNVTISGNLMYTGNYSVAGDIPKTVIYARNITIACEVTRVDAVLIADNTVKTCDSDDVQAERNSQQLVINGTIIAGRLVANRTYGAATGVNSIVPAEVIDYDSTLYLWGSREADVTASGKLTTTYIYELSPRY